MVFLPSKTLRRTTIVGLLYAALACGATWPLVTRLSSSLPMGREVVATVPLLNLWTLWWNCDRLGQGYAGYWNAPIFHPMDGAFAFSEPQPWTATAALCVAGGQPALGYNLLLIAALVLNGLLGWRLLCRAGLREEAAMVGGGWLVTLPFVHNELGVLQLVPLFGMLWTIERLVMFREGPTFRRAALLGVAVAMTYATCIYYTLFMALVLAPSGLVLVGRHVLQPRVWLQLALGGMVAAVAILPLAVSQRRALAAQETARPAALLQQLSARPVDYLVEPWPSPCGWSWPWAAPRERIRLSPGWIKYGLAALGLLAGLRDSRTRRWAVFGAVLLAAGFLMSIGPRIGWPGFSPYAFLAAVVPGLEQARNVYRFGVFVQLGVVFLAAIALDYAAGLPAWLRRQATSARFRTVAGWAVVVGVGGLAMFETWPPQQTLFECPPAAANQGWLTWLRDETPDSAVLACVPFPAGRTVADYESTALWMYFQIWHRRPLVNGYSGVFPEDFLRLKQLMAGFPDEPSLEALAARDVAFCVVRDGEVTTKIGDGHAFDRHALRRVHRDARAGIAIYRLETAEAGRQASGEAPPP
jgi:hypothetical protein